METDARTSAGRGSAAWLAAVWGPPALVAAAIFAISSVPGDRLPRSPMALDLAAHFAEFAALGLVLARALSLTGRPIGAWARAALSTLSCLSFGLLDELHQLLTPYRVFDTADLAMDLLGGLAGSVLYLHLAARRDGGGRS